MEQLVLEDLSARLSYGVNFALGENIYTVKGIDLIVTDEGDWEYAVTTKCGEPIEIKYIKPYLRPMSSMTEEEKREFQSFYPGSFGNQWLDIKNGSIDIFECSSTITLYLDDSKRIIDWLNKKMFDYRGLIEEGLALVAPKDMYKS